MKTMNLSDTIRLLPDFDLSIVMPFYKRLDEFKRVFPVKTPYYQRNGIEVIIVADEPSQKEDIIDYIRQYPFINWKVVVNEQDHPWRNSAKAFNVGVRQSTKKYVMIMNPELEFYNDVIYILRKDLDLYPDHFAVGQLIITDLELEITEKNLFRHRTIPYGSIMAKKEYFEQISGYNEQYTEWGGEVDNLRIRFELAGIRKLFYPEALLIHREDFLLRTTSHNEQRNQIPKELLTDILLPDKVTVNNGTWGTDFDTVFFNWTDNPFAKEQCLEYLSELEDYQLATKGIFDKKYQLIALIPTYNEADRIEGCLRSVEKHCDGIIVLDDESTDNTYELIQSSKLLLKSKKKRECFNDKQNRNILLDLASFFKTEWFIFIDADERFDERFIDLPEIMNKENVDTVGVWIANLWDSMETYRTDMLDSHPLSQNGLWFRWRMFRNKGQMKIIHNNKLHFDSVPYLNNTYASQTLFLHLGYLTNQKRSLKYDFYQSEDKMSTSYYEDILKEVINTRKISLLTHEEINDIKQKRMLKILT